MAYATASDLKTYLDISGTTDDTLLAALISRAQAIIDRETGTTFEAANDSTRYFDAVTDIDGRYLMFDRWIASITTVTNGDSVEVTSSEYAKEPRGDGPYYGIKLLGSSTQGWTYTTDHENAITVVGRWAWSTTPPADIVHATLRLAAFLYRQRDNANDVDRAIVVGNATVLPSQMPADVRTLIMPYRSLTGWG